MSSVGTEEAPQASTGDQEVTVDAEEAPTTEAGAKPQASGQGDAASAEGRARAARPE